MTEALILGGGVAGLTAAIHVLERGYRPLVLEAAPTPGGRVRSFVDPHTGEELDNGPHLLLGACQESLALLERLGSRSQLWQSDRMRIPFWTPAAGWYALDCPDWPTPWHLLAGLHRMPELTLGEKGLVLALGWHLARGIPPRPGQTVMHWLQERRQTTRLLHSLWEPLCLAIMNEPPASADAGLFMTVLRQVMAGKRGAGQLFISKVPLSRLLAEPACDFIQRQGGEVRCRSAVRQLIRQGDRVTAVVTAAGVLPVQGPVIAALPHHVLMRLIPDWDPGWRVTPAYAPIVSVHLRWPLPGRLPEPLVGLPAGVCHWLFDRALLAGDAELAPARISAVISGAYREVHWSTLRLLDMAYQATVALVPALGGLRVVATRDAKKGNQGLVLGRVVREWRATLAPWPDLVASRPGPKTPWRNLFLAGDWTQTGLPATIESAVCSGKTAATFPEQIPF
ncbi:MAG: hydroxysqualene dehydroxylase HpnE [Magnetococcus sp. DMHC-1]